MKKMLDKITNTLTKGRQGKGEQGFTLVELIVVISILGVLSSLALPTISPFLGRSKDRAYNADLERVQLAVDAYYSDPGNDRFLGKRQYPILATLKSDGAFVQPDNDNAGQTTSITGNPLGGTQGGAPKWIDDDNGIRDNDEEALNDEDDEDVTGWHVATVDREGTDYLADSRDYFVDFDALVAKGFLTQVPESASPDNKAPGSTNAYNGSYSWYVNEFGVVETVLFFFPESQNTGFLDAYP